MVVAARRPGLAVPVGIRLGPVPAMPDVEPADAAAVRGLRLGHHRGVRLTPKSLAGPAGLSGGAHKTGRTPSVGRPSRGLISASPGRR